MFEIFTVEVDATLNNSKLAAVVLPESKFMVVEDVLPTVFGVVLPIFTFEVPLATIIGDQIASL